MNRQEVILAVTPFDKLEWERQHILHLRDAVEKALLESAPCYFENLRKTCARYIENNKDTPNRKELNALMETYAKVIWAADDFHIKGETKSKSITFTLN